MGKKEQIEDYYRVMKEIESEDLMTQRDIAENLGFSLGKVNYLMKSLTEKGLIKLENFKNSKNKSAYRYILTPEGIRHKIFITKEFLKRKEVEYVLMQREIEELKREIGDNIG